MVNIDVIYILSGFNQILASAITILAFSLFVYMLVHNIKNAVGKAFVMLLACVCFTYAGDVALFRVTNVADAIPWLRFQWIGIAFIPAAYLHFADAILRTTNAHSSRRRFAVFTAYLFGFLLLLLVLQTEYLVHDPFQSQSVTQFRAGPFFQVFTFYFYATLIWGAYKIFLARNRALTSATRRRMTYLSISFVAPALGVYPYMLIASTPTISPSVLLFTMFCGNILIAIMIMLMAYSVAFVGVLSPERVVKHNLVHFLLRGTLVAIIIIVIIQVLPKQPQIWGLPRDFILQSSIVVVFIVSQLLIDLSKPFIGQLLFYQDRLEIAWISELDRRLLTTTDLQQALENILITLCELLRVETGFIYNLKTRQGTRLEAQVGSTEQINNALTDIDVSALINSKNGQSDHQFIRQNNFWFVILKNKTRSQSLGLLGIEIQVEGQDLSLDQAELAGRLLAQAELALEDRLLQQEVFVALKNIIPEMERVQQLRRAVPYLGTTQLIVKENSPIHKTEFTQQVRDALKHYWGGPKLTSSPLLDLRVVKDNLKENDDDSVRALRSVLNEAIEKQRPEGERQMNATRWLIYNILDLKFVQGMRVRDIAQRLAMSESDLYRKQRLAIEEVARTLKDMEAQGDDADNIEVAE
ncbi:histidine kinase N-terminal 7TM domain-containing protein [Anaerolineales bacterium HSG25]|nr:histidine kinase N-terminal 7TM domain-containing protein [Anaerolineales bacterium HSG25]